MKDIVIAILAIIVVIFFLVGACLIFAAFYAIFITVLIGTLFGKPFSAFCIGIALLFMGFVLKNYVDWIDN